MDDLRAVTLEQQVLGSILSLNAFYSVNLCEDDFCSLENQTIFKAIARRARAGQELDFQLLFEDMRVHNEIDKAGGVQYVLQVLKDGFCSISLVEAVQKLREYSLRRKLLFLAPALEKMARQTEEPIEDLLADIQTQVMSLAQDPEGQHRGMDEIYDAYKARKEEVERGRIYKIPTGFKSLDRLLDGGVEDGQFIVVAARPSMGKTAFGLRLSANMGKHGKYVLFMSLEQTEEKIIDRLVAAEGGINSSDLHSKEGLRANWESLMGALESLRNSRLILDARAGATVANIATRARQLHAKGMLDAIVIDYLQLIKPRAGERAGTPREQVVAGIADDLFALAHSLHVPVIALAQTNRATESRQDKRPVLTDIRESDKIVMDADVVIALHREEYYAKERTPDHMRGIVDVLVLKNRDGRIGTVNLHFLPEQVDFCELSETELMMASGRPLSKKESRDVESITEDA